MESEARNMNGGGKEVFYSMTRNIELMFDPRTDMLKDTPT